MAAGELVIPGTRPSGRSPARLLLARLVGGRLRGATPTAPAGRRRRRAPYPVPPARHRTAYRRPAGARADATPPSVVRLFD
ncbi:hypothetical protein LQ51_05810 [Micromonospora sp. HK10]|nr:hypothetical protein LQ51_05810 [Micromonospora sp. HK10]